MSEQVFIFICGTHTCYFDWFVFDFVHFFFQIQISSWIIKLILVTSIGFALLYLTASIFCPLSQWVWARSLFSLVDRPFYLWTVWPASALTHERGRSQTQNTFFSAGPTFIMIPWFVRRHREDEIPVKKCLFTDNVTFWLKSQTFLSCLPPEWWWSSSEVT